MSARQPTPPPKNKVRPTPPPAPPAKKVPAINVVLALQEQPPVSDDAEAATERMLAAMDLMTPRERVIAQQVLSDFYCPRCGIEQPYGDCQCK